MRGVGVHGLRSLECMDGNYSLSFREAQKFFSIALTEQFTSLLDSMRSGSVPSSPGPEASFEVKGPVGHTGLVGSDDDSAPPTFIMAMEKCPRKEETRTDENNR